MVLTTTIYPPTSHQLPPRPPLHLKPCAEGKPNPNQTQCTPACTECGKRFSSWKALFGHMRCHPERNWRGIKPPTQVRRAHFTEDEFQVAAILLLLSNGPPAASEPLSYGFCLNRLSWVPRHGRVRKKRKRKMVDQQFWRRLFGLNS